MMQREGFEIGMACHLARVSRAGFYREWCEHAPRQADVELRDVIQRIVVENRCYGYRRVAAELQAQGRRENRKRVLRLMREDNLLALRRRRFVSTTESAHQLAIYPNLAARCTPEGIDQLWVADLTYVRLREQFVYVAVILDAYSRRVVGWHVGERLDVHLTLEALNRALRQRRIEPGGLVHHSDRGLQYCWRAYVERLEEQGVRISMSRKGRPWDNAKAESFMKTLKCEEVYLRPYRDLAHARDSIGEFIDQVYNARRLHSALQYRSPAQFEAEQSQAGMPPTLSQDEA